MAEQRRRQPPRGAARVSRLRGRPGEGHPDRHASQRLRVRELRGPQLELPAAARGRDHAGDLHRPRDDVLLLLQGPRRQPRRAAVRQLRRLGGLQEMDADQRGVPRQPDRALRRRREGGGRGGRRRAVRRDPPPGDGGRARARAAARRDPHRGLRAMRLVTYDNGTGAEAGVLVEEQVVPVSALDAPARSVRGLLEPLDAAGLLALGERAAASDERLALESVRLLAPVPDPEKIICLGLNYRDHAAETGQELPAAPLWFAKFANSLIGSGEEIVLPAAHPEYVDYEAELAVVIGRPTNRVQRRAGTLPRRRRDAVQRRQRPRPAVAEPAVDQRQGDRHVRPLRPRDRHARRGRRPRRARAAHADQRRAAAAGHDGEHDLLRPSRRVALAHDDAPARRHHRDGHAGRRRRCAGPLPARRRHRRGGDRRPRHAGQPRARGISADQGATGK